MTTDQDLSARLASVNTSYDETPIASFAQKGVYSHELRTLLEDAYRSGQLITLADHEAAVAKAVEAERERNNRSHSAATLFWVRASQKALAGDPRELQNRVDLCTADPADVVLSAAAIRSRGVAG